MNHELNHELLTGAWPYRSSGLVCMIYLLPKWQSPLGKHLPPDEVSLWQSLSDLQVPYKKFQLHFSQLSILFTLFGLKERQEDIVTDRMKIRSNFMIGIWWAACHWTDMGLKFGWFLYDATARRATFRFSNGGITLNHWLEVSQHTHIQRKN